MINPYQQEIEIEKLLALQNLQYQASIFTQIEVPAGQQINQAVNISSVGHFWCQTITGSYTTNIDGDPDPLDDGICRQSVQLIDGNNTRELFEDFIPANLFLSPGRIQGISGVGADSEPLRREFVFSYVFLANGQIIVKVKNDSDYTNTTRIHFKGIRIFMKSRQVSRMQNV